MMGALPLVRGFIESAADGDALEIDIVGDIAMTGVITIPSGVDVTAYSSTGAVITAAAMSFRQMAADWISHRCFCP